MDKNSLQTNIREILTATSKYGFSIFACVKSGGTTVLKKFLLEDKENDSFKDEVGKIISELIIEKFCCEDFCLENIENIHDNKAIFYSIPQNETYNPFSFFEEQSDDVYKQEDKNDLIGFAFKYNVNTKSFFAFQQVYPVTVPKKKNGLYIFQAGDVYKKMDKDLLRIDYRVDIIVVDSIIITANINLLQNKYGFENFIRSEAQITISAIEKFEIVKDMGKIMEFEAKDKLTNAKKLMKIKSSPVLKMNKTRLIDKISTLPRYKDKFKIEDETIIVNTYNDVKELLKMLNDDYLKSELTDEEYESPSKQLLPHED